MMVVDESLYGWGVCNIPMPRSTHDIFSDRRKKNGRVSFTDRRSASELPGILSSISGALAHDVPWFQTMVVSIFALLSMAFIFLISQMIPEFMEKEMPEPVDIIIRLTEGTQKISAPPVDKTPQPIIDEDIIEKSILLKKPIKEVKPISEKPRFEVNRDPLPMLKQQPVPEENIPDIRIYPKIRQQTSSTEETYVPQASSLEKMTQPEEINISVSADRKDRYNHKERVLRKNKPLNTGSASSFVSKQSKEQSVIALSTKKPQKKYELNTNNQALMVPSGKMDFPSETQNVQIATDVTAKDSQKKYKIKTKAQVMVVPVENTGSLLTHSHVADTEISSEINFKKDYKTDTEKQAIFVPAENNGSLLTSPNEPAATVSPVERFQKNYQVDAEDRKVGIPSVKSDSLLTRPEVVATVDPAKKSEKSYQIDMSSNKIEARDNKSISFADVTINDIDPSHLINLKELAVCADPEEEFKLKTKLATLLREPTKCESNGILLFFKYPESGYTISVKIYNPGGVVLKDRCSVLRLAVECINDQKAKGVIP